MNIIESIAAAAIRYPDRVAHVGSGGSTTYRELWDKSSALAAGLSARLGQDRRPIAVLGHKEPGMLIAFLGAVKSGRPYVPIDSSIPLERRAAILRNSNAALVIEAAAVDQYFKDASAWQAPQPLQNDPFYIIFTSGTTGDPKGVVITHGCLSAFLEWMHGEQHFQPGTEVFLNQAPFSFDLSVMDLYLSLTTAGTLWSVTKEEISNPKVLFQRLAESGISTWVSTPSFAQMCLTDPKFHQGMLPNLRRLLFCGETLASETASGLLDRFPDAAVWNTYGPTEATVATTSIRITRKDIEKFPALPIGYEMPGVRVLICDEHDQEVAHGERGEIHIAGPNVSPGYLGRPDLTARAFYVRDGERAYRTGDWGRAHERLLFCEGRKDQQIKWNGYRIELGDIESHVRSLSGVSDAVVLAKQTNGKVEGVYAFVIVPERREASEFREGQRLRNELSARLPAYMLPRKFLFLDNFPITQNGKADRRQLLQTLG